MNSHQSVSLPKPLVDLVKELVEHNENVSVLYTNPTDFIKDAVRIRVQEFLSKSKKGEPLPEIEAEP